MANYVACNNKPYLGPHVKLPIFCPIVTEFRMSLQILKKVSNTKFHENASSGNRNDTLGRTDGYDEGNRHFPRVYERP